MNKLGQSGIGTLIIFISMLLVATIAAGVLIQTTSSLQNKALITGNQAKGQISTNIQIISVSGTNGSDANIENVTMIAKLSPGSDDIDLSEVVIVLDTPTASENLMYSPLSAPPSERFVVEYIQNGTGHQDGYLKYGDVAEITFLSGSPLEESTIATIDVIPKIGLPSHVSMLMPDIMAQYRVKLYP